MKHPPGIASPDGCLAERTSPLKGMLVPDFTYPEATRAAAITAALHEAPDNRDHEAIRAYLHRLSALGLAVLFVLPGTKRPADMRTPRQRNAEDRAAQQAAREAGRPNWQKVKSPAGLTLATIDVGTLDRYLDTYISTFSTLDDNGALVEPAAVNIAVEVGASGLVVVDADTPDQVSAYTAAMAEPSSAAAPTVSTPGARNEAGEMVHHDGGHWYFVVPEGVDLPDGPGNLKSSTNDDGYAALWSRRFVLIPPSTRPEGQYKAMGEVAELPTQLLETILEHDRVHAERAQRVTSTALHEGLVAAWGSLVSWAEILEPTGWMNTGKPDNCGCDIWTASGPHSSPKSATAHEPGCTRFSDSPDPPLYIWTDSTDIDPFGSVVADHGPTLTRLRAVAAIHYNNHLGAAMDALNLHDDEPQTFGPFAVYESQEPDASQGGDDTTERKILGRASEIWIDREARKRLADYDAQAVTLPEVVSLDALLALPDDSQRMRIEKVLPSGGAKVLCAAPAGAGKTTLNGNLVRSLVDGDPFLGAFAVNQRAERIVIIDNEMTQEMLKRWLRRQGVRNASAVVDVVTLRGQAGLFDLGSDRIRNMWTRRLSDIGCDFLIFDCLSPVINAMGLKESTELGKFLHPLTDMLTAAGVLDVLVQHHMGHDAERARGDSTALGWSDANWKMIRDRENGKDNRYFATDKVRDADELVPEGLLSFNQATGRLTYDGGNRAQTRTSNTVEKRLQEVLGVLADHAAHGDQGITTTAVKVAVGGRKEITTQALELAEKRKLVLVTYKGRAKVYRINPAAQDPHITSLLGQP